MPASDLTPLLDRVLQRTGYPVSVAAAPEIGTHCQLRSATPERPGHVLLLNPVWERWADYIIAHQFQMILIKWDDPGGVHDLVEMSDTVAYQMRRAAKRVRAQSTA